MSVTKTAKGSAKGGTPGWKWREPHTMADFKALEGHLIWVKLEERAVWDVTLKARVSTKLVLYTANGPQVLSETPKMYYGYLLAVDDEGFAHLLMVPGDYSSLRPIFPGHSASGVRTSAKVSWLAGRIRVWAQ